MKQCIICNKELLKRKRKFCSRRCTDRDYYLKNKEKIKERNKEWERKNPEKVFKIRKKAFDKFYKNKRERFNELMRNEYHRNKNKWRARGNVRAFLIRPKNKDILIKECKKCSTKENLSLRYKTYPTKAKEIKKEIKKENIYYLCKRCRYEKSI